MKNILSLLIVLIFNFQIIHSQSCSDPLFSELNWLSYFGGSGDDEIIDVDVDQLTGNIYVLGTTSNSNFLPNIHTIGNNSAAKNTFVACLDDASNVLWATIILGWDMPSSIHMNNDKTLTLVGITSMTTLPGPPQTPTHDNTHNGGTDVLILKLSNNGQNLLYQSYFGGNGDELPASLGPYSDQNGPKNTKLKVKYRPINDNILLTGITTSNNIITTSNALDTSLGNIFFCELSTNPNNQHIVYSSNYLSTDGIVGAKWGNLSSIFSPLPNGGSAFISTNGDNRYQSHISQNAIDDQYSGYFPNPQLFIFNPDFSVNYSTNIGAWRMDNVDPDGAYNGVPGDFNYFDFDIEYDLCGNIYFYSKGQGFKTAIFKKEYLYQSTKYYPKLQDISIFNDQYVMLHNPIIKINLEAPEPFIELIMDFGYGGTAYGSNSEIKIDSKDRIHIFSVNEHTEYQGYFDNLGQQNQSNFHYQIFSSDLNVLSTYNYGVNTNLINSYSLGLVVKNDKTYIYGLKFDPGLSTTTSWTDNQGVTHNTLQPNFSGGLSDGFIGKIENICNDVPFDCCANKHPAYDALKTLYESTNGLGWSNNEGWTDSCNPCEWFGVNCDANDNVIGLELSDNNLDGEIPEIFDQLPYLNVLHLNSNNLIGIIPGTICDLTNIESIWLHQNQLHGVIPPCIGYLNDLSQISLAENNLSGSIPGELGFLTNLEVMLLFGNNLSGCYHPNLRNLCSQLTHIGSFIDNGNTFDSNWDDYCLIGLGECDQCDTDIVPPILTCGVPLINIDILSNGIAIADAGDFDIVAIDNCDINVQIIFTDFNLDCSYVGGPTIYQTVVAVDDSGNTSQCQVGVNVRDPLNYCCNHPDLLALQAFYDATNGDQWKNTVAGNKPWFEDCDPCGLHDGTPWYGITCNGNHRVSALGLNFNNLVGTIPPSIDGLNEVNWLVLYDNPGLTGIIPNTICNIPHLQFFSLLRNNHTGSIPPCMANMASLVEVNFASNDFTGTIPAFGTNNPNLVNLLLANNQLSGSLPTSLINIPNPSTITFNNNNLSGCYPPQLADLCDHNMGTITGLNNSKVSDGNSFAAPWEDFCSSGAGTCTSSVKDNQEIDFSIVPNPSDNFTKIIGTDIDKVQLYDIYGKLVRESVKSEIYIGDFSSGMYLVKVESNSQFGFKYFVKI
ncbi:MAG: T9SS type A sorting domain-containing protein [Lewinellaceae bacterium]|nr:T9SS type A sorting domain-containing protein [Lewinellaceae bacterium]